ncbi:site-specific DNA-methyltransferase [Pseudomonas sp. S1Bt30]|uniref:Methyltransferase n=1 Tax=Pseudomonas quebecensis TaxID=2995174 RepID=A0ABY6QPC6_9PSED|nr:site-specific DNA-methyltransferase [Pseudomonas quebecensis]MCX4067255.1 site-specific DNA-methyltransferase [Pseudomonas quebecensis]UZW21159.1 site-specific DNA-methyltransferase [Pseudomonas quebecensis]UZW26315.1 site-specific DNA-methyltransferase [Pseudomonas quebecensis]UZW31376.1 site-specific DNA-methyltransferase [Pseudomonas quebecensis]
MKQHRVLIGDCIESMRTLPDKSVQMCVTSPPYYGLRDYGVDGQIGLEETPAEFIARLVEVFREVRRVLRDDGTAWVNMGDSYAGSWGAHGRDDMGVGVSTLSQRQVMASQRKAKSTTHAEYKPKDLMGMPWRLAFALQDDGWYLRQDIIWHKPNPMPESTRDRCTKAHEYIFLLSKSRRYHCDMTAIREPAIYGATPSGVGFGHGFDVITKPRATVPTGWDTSTGDGGHGAFHKDGAERARRDSFKREGSKREQAIPGQAVGTHRPDREESSWDVATRNKRSVWTVATHAFKEAHFATFPPDLIRPCILAGAPLGGTVLDPFGGAGTTAVVAMQEGRKSILCELNPEYAAMAERRIAAAWLDGAAQMDVFRDTVQHPAA